MAGEQVTLVSHVTPNVRAGTDLRAYQYKWVQIHGAGVLVANVASGPGLSCQQGVNSGLAVPIATAPNIAKMTAGEAIAIGAMIEPMSASGLSRATLATSNAAICGRAWSAAAGSGELFSVLLV